MTAAEFYKDNWILKRDISKRQSPIKNNSFITNSIDNRSYNIVNNNTTVVQNIVSDTSTGFITGNGNVVDGTGAIVTGDNNNIQGNNSVILGGSNNNVTDSGVVLINTTNISNANPNSTYIGGNNIFFQSNPQVIIHIVRGETNAFNKFKNIHIVGSGHNTVRPLSGVSTNTEFILNGNYI
jgi:hypothetical protein